MAQIPDNTNTTLYALDQAVQAKAEDWRRAHLGASQIGHSCKRALWYGFHWCKAPEFSGRQLRLFARGQREEDVFVELLKNAGVTVTTHDESTGQQYRFSDLNGHFAGSMDAAAVGLIEAPKTWHVLEFKTHNAKSFKALSEQGVQKAKPMHYSQMQMYMHWTGMERAYYMAVCKDDDSLYGERVHYDKDHAKALIEKAASIIKANEPPEGISQNAGWYECQWCDYHSLCFEQVLPEQNCRTCLHSTPTHNGLWHCEATAQMGEPPYFKAEDQKHHCSMHLFIPALFNKCTVVDACPDGTWVEYEQEDGTLVKNKAGGTWE